MDTNQLRQVFDLNNYLSWMDSVIASFESGGRNISSSCCQELKEKRERCVERLEGLRG